ncbi:hypothetical protein BDZ88DRAFT_326681 [Geranomyces variabilis]|nr:hypothetical protein BDZ88DRAFT_326681 [Geranomyces variabilis]
MLAAAASSIPFHPHTTNVLAPAAFASALAVAWHVFRIHFLPAVSNTDPSFSTMSLATLHPPCERSETSDALQPGYATPLDARGRLANERNFHSQTVGVRGRRVYLARRHPSLAARTLQSSALPRGFCKARPMPSGGSSSSLESPGEGAKLALYRKPALAQS